ncbi:MAG: DUF2202 domain-containing protein [Epsilonproteobacteria bacterium]|nr:hypothetical protein [Campylobacterota bacterium]NPA57395.1 DUF2202 domain-containing protein [Campylobacterota bacterium]
MRRVLVTTLVAGTVAFGATAPQTYIEELVHFLAGKSLPVNGKFYQYDFEHDNHYDPNDWIYVTSDGRYAFRLLAVTPSENNAFGFAPVELPADLPATPNGYFININFPQDRDERFSWVYATHDTGKVYKLMGATADNQFDYLDLNGDGVPDPLPIRATVGSPSSLPGTSEELVATFSYPSGGAGGNGGAMGDHGDHGHNGEGMTPITTPVDTTLTPEQRYEIAWMYNEEKLAHDVYLNLYELYKDQGWARPLYNIGEGSESQHMAAVRQLAEAYDVNVSDDYMTPYDPDLVASLDSGEFAVSDIQSLYNTLYEKGSQSLQDALEVGCIVEVTDVVDLNEALQVAEGNEDLTRVFTYLRSGSYNHYWAFDRALKQLGVEDGCCSLGEEYCKTPEEFPTGENGQGAGGQGQGNGNGGGYGKGNGPRR